MRLMNFIKKSILLAFLFSMASLTCCFTSCVTKQTTTVNGQFVEERYVIKRPVKNFIQNVEVQ